VYPQNIVFELLPSIEVFDYLFALEGKVDLCPSHEGIEISGGTASPIFDLHVR